MDPSLSKATELLSHAGFVRSLALSLVRDPSQAEDVEQDTWVAALVRPPRREEGARPWLATVARNLVRKGFRSALRRERREVIAARHEALPSAAEMVEREQTLQRVVEAVLSLREPYRSSILLRFYEGLTPRDIARRQGAPLETVRSRLGRALDQLRELLDKRYGGSREAWCLGLISLVGERFSAGAAAAAGTTALSLGGFAMSWKVAATIALLGMSATLWTVWPSRLEAEQTTGEGTHPASALEGRPDPMPAVAEAKAEKETEARIPLDPEAQQPPEGVMAAPPNASAPAVILAGQIHVDGKPPAETLTLLFKGEETSVEAKTGPGGTFQFEGLPPRWSGKILLPPGFHLEKASQGQILDLDEEFRGEEGVKLDFPAGNLFFETRKLPVIRGRIVDLRTGEPVPGANLEGNVMRTNGENSQMYGVGDETDSSGRFEVPLREGKVQNTEFWVRRALHPGQFPVTVDSRLLDRDLDLGDMALPPERVIDFEVRDPAGEPIGGAIAFAGERGGSGKSGPTDSQGRSFLLISDPKAVTMEVGALGYKIAEVAIPQETENLLRILLERSNRLEILLRDPEGTHLSGLAARILSRKPLFAPHLPEEPVEGGVPPRGSYPPPLLVEAGANSFSYGFFNSSEGTIVVGLGKQSDGRVLLSSIRPEVPFRIEFVDPLDFPVAEFRSSGLGPVDDRKEEIRTEKKPGRIWGLVRDEAGNPVPGVLACLSAGGPSSVEIETDSSGHFLQSGLFSPAVTLALLKQGYQTLTAQGLSPDDSPTPREFTLRRE